MSVLTHHVGIDDITSHTSNERHPTTYKVLRTGKGLLVANSPHSGQSRPAVDGWLAAQSMALGQDASDAGGMGRRGRLSGPTESLSEKQLQNHVPQ